MDAEASLRAAEVAVAVSSKTRHVWTAAVTLWVMTACCGLPIVYQAWHGVRTQNQAPEVLIRVIERGGPNCEAAVERLRQVATECIGAIRRSAGREGREGQVATVALEHLRHEFTR